MSWMAETSERAIIRRVFLFFRLSNASFVSCAAAVGGERTAAASTPHPPSQKSKGKNTKKAARPGSEKIKTGGAGDDEGTPSVSFSGGCEAAAEQPLKGGAVACWEETPTMGVDAVAVELSRRARIPDRRASAPLYFAFDHCFSVRGQGTILTGTVLTGEVKVSINHERLFMRSNLFSVYKYFFVDMSTRLRRER